MSPSSLSIPTFLHQLSLPPWIHPSLVIYFTPPSHHSSIPTFPISPPLFHCFSPSFSSVPSLHPLLLSSCIFYFLSAVLTVHCQTTEDTVVAPFVIAAMFFLSPSLSLRKFVTLLSQTSHVTAALQLVLSADANVALCSPFTLSLHL